MGILGPVKDHARLQMHMDVSERLLMREFSGKMLQAKAGQSSCAPAPSTCTWTSQKKPFMREFASKMSQANAGTSVLCEPLQACTVEMRMERPFTRKSRNIWQGNAEGASSASQSPLPDFNCKLEQCALRSGARGWGRDLPMPERLSE